MEVTVHCHFKCKPLVDLKSLTSYKALCNIKDDEVVIKKYRLRGKVLQQCVNVKHGLLH